MAADAPDRDMATALMALEGTAEAIGEREYAGVRCTAKRLPMQGPKTETCVSKVRGWPVALYMQFDAPENGGLQWYRATRIDERACIRASEIAIPAGVKIEDRRDAAGENQDGT